MAKKKDILSSYDSSGDDFAIKMSYNNGYLTKEKDLLNVNVPGKTNKTDSSPDDILQVAVQCKKCGVYMDFIAGKEWCSGKYVCPICKEYVTEETSLNAISSGNNFFDYDDIFGRWK